MFVKKEGLAALSTTRWTVWALFFERIFKNYQHLLELWREYLSGKLDPDVKARTIGCRHKMKKFNFFLGLNHGEGRLVTQTTFQEHCRTQKCRRYVVSTLQT